MNLCEPCFIIVLLKVFHFFLHLGYLINLLRYLGAGAGARAEAGAGAGAYMKKPVCRLNLPSLWCLGWRMSSINFWVKGEIISVWAKNKIGPAYLSVNAQLICSQGKQRLTLDHMSFDEMIFQPIFYYENLITFFIIVFAPDIS